MSLTINIIYNKSEEKIIYDNSEEVQISNFHFRLMASRKKWSLDFKLMPIST